MLTPLEIESKIFSKSISGYNIGEVKHFMRDILSDYEKMYRENIELKDKLNVLNEGIQYYKTIESTLQNTLVLAEKMAEETRVVAKHKAEQIEKEAEIKGANVIMEAKNEVYKIHQAKEDLLKNYDVSKIQVLQILKTQLEFIENNSLDIHSNSSSIELFINNKVDQETADESDKNNNK